MSLAVTISCDPKDAEKLVDTELDTYAEIHARVLDGPLLDLERRAIKTYLAWKLGRFPAMSA